MHTLKDTLSYNLQHQLHASQYYPKPKKKKSNKNQMNLNLKRLR